MTSQTKVSKSIFESLQCDTLFPIPSVSWISFISAFGLTANKTTRFLLAICALPCTELACKSPNWQSLPETTFSNFSSPAILTTVNYSYSIELGQRLEKTIFVSETLKEFFKGVSNRPQNLNEFGKELPFASVDGSVVFG